MGYAMTRADEQTAGSIISPCEASSVVGIKPTVGLVSRSAVVPISPQQDTLGPMGRTVEDAAAMLSAMAGRDPHDSKTDGIPFDCIPDYQAASHRRDVSQYRIGIPRQTFDKVSQPILDAFEDVVEKLRTQGATIVDCEYAGQARYRTMTSDQKCAFLTSEFKPALAAYFSSLTTNPHDITDLAAIVSFTRATPAEEFPARPIEFFEQSLAIADDAEALREAAEVRTYLGSEGGVPGALDTYKLDALLFPTEAWTTNYLAAAGGSPQIAIPLGFLPADFPVEMNDTGTLVSRGPNIP